MHYFDSYPIKSRIKAVHPMLKIVLFAIYTAMALSSHSIVFMFLLLVTFIAFTQYTARISTLRLLRLMIIPAGFVLLGSFSVVLDVNPVAAMYKVGIGSYFIGLSEASIHRAVLLFTRSILSIVILYSLVLNTPVADIIYVLRKMKVPEIILDLLVLVYRSIFILSDTAQSIFVSQKSRLGYRHLNSTMRSTSQLAGSVFILSGVRAEQMFRSMESRGYNGKINTLQAEWTTDKKCILISVVMLLVFSVLFNASAI